MSFLAMMAALAAPPQVDGRPGAPAEKPNVILIMADDFGYECVAADGGSYKTPNLDRLAAAGVRFERCYAQPLCTPSRVQLMTGQYNQRNYVKFGYMDPGQQTFANWFRAAGYATGVFGKWQLRGDFNAPDRFGFDEYYLWQLNRRPPRYANPGLDFDGKNVDFNGGEYGPDLVSDRLCAFIEKNKDRPFLAYYPMILTHDPYEPTPDSPDYLRDSKGPEGGPRRRQGTNYFPDMVSYADKIIGKIVSRLESLGLLGRTIVIFTADNGTGRAVVSTFNGRPCKGGKGLLKESGMHVPLIIWGQGMIPPGRVCRDLVDFTDVAPTLLDAAGIRRPEGWILDGRSLWTYLTGGALEPRGWTYSWFSKDGGKDGREFAMGYRLKLYREGRLFDVQSDPEEERPLDLEKLSAEFHAEYSVLQSVLKKFQGTRPEWTYAATIPSKKKSRSADK